MRSRAVLGMVALSFAGCALESSEVGSATDAEPTAEQRSDFDASLFKFSVWVPDDHQGSSGGSQRAAATLNFVDTREVWFDPPAWNCHIAISMPIRHSSYGVITPERAAYLTAEVAEAASATVMHSQPKWPITGLVCKRFADKMVELFLRAPGGPFGAK